MSDIKFSCSACGQNIVCDAEFIGRTTTCPMPLGYRCPVATGRTRSARCRGRLPFRSCCLTRKATPSAASVKTSGRSWPSNRMPSPKTGEIFWKRDDHPRGAGNPCGSIFVTACAFLLAGKLPLPGGTYRELVWHSWVIGHSYPAWCTWFGLGCVSQKNMGHLHPAGFRIYRCDQCTAGNHRRQHNGWISIWIAYIVIQNGHKASAIRRQLKQVKQVESTTNHPEPRFSPAASAMLEVSR